ncbi:hypothetical protein EDD80_11915 [Anseongella ginsenosidimutans]|uniref:Outer membrane protein with beta-barrel domain n=1 Tax=Anseongella ginsenosidimutans TaxID=496056 RepID=A0A4V2UT87_9SPHI|nr:hypothetical protein [Anseongella ginsenosidimutans]QEC52799.1 hypothetical protein FRZ59_10920 [Anseongella ginsenosidimutans]TCS84701.1 hypothetical protein EDD80_11915 [Anseongella ginsenosidimutans]
MELKYIAILPFLLFCNTCFSQENTKQAGYFNITEVGYIKGMSASYSGSKGYKAPSAGSLRTINGVFLSPEWSLGIGIGLDGYNKSHDEGLFRQYHNTAPVFFDARYYIDNSPNTPLVFTDIGYSLSWGDNFDKGLMLNIGGGYKFFPGSKTCLIAALGYNLQQIEGAVNAASDNLNLHSASLHVGFLF